MCLIPALPYVGEALVIGATWWASQNAIHADGDYSPWSPNPAVNEEYIRDRDALKDAGYTKTPYQDPNDPKCDELQKRIDDINKELGGRDSFNNKWFSGIFNKGHADRVKNLTAERDRYQRRLNRGDCKKCP
jgi:hypothetical protein